MKSYAELYGSTFTDKTHQAEPPVQVLSDHKVSTQAGPKYDFTSKGAKTLDLGFGSRVFSSKSAATEGLTWEKLRQARIHTNTPKNSMPQS